MKNLAKLNGVNALSKKEQKSIFGGWDTGFCIRFCLNDPDPCDWRSERCGCGTVIICE